MGLFMTTSAFCDKPGLHSPRGLRSGLNGKRPNVTGGSLGNYYVPYVGTSTAFHCTIAFLGCPFNFGNTSTR
jgi:hypothetical protein